LSTQIDPLHRYVPAIALEWEARASGRSWLATDASLLFVDISGFTNLSERLAARGRIGAEELTSVLGSVFGRMLDIVHARGGSMLKFGGDALLLMFEGDDHALRATTSAIQMRAALRDASKEKTSVGRVNLRMSSGVHSGPVDLFLVGDSHRELIVTGPTASITTEMEATADAGEILVSRDTAALLPPAFVGEAKGDGLLIRRTRVSDAPPVRDMGGDPSTAIAPLVPVALRDYLASGAADSEHRIANVGFVKFKGVDALLASEGHEAVATHMDYLLSAIQEAADAEQITFLATDIDTDGGKVIVATGVPVAQHDDEGRILRALRSVVETPTVFDVRAGVNRGHVFAGSVGGRWRATYTVMGDTVNLAARLMAAAGPGQLYAHPSVLDLAATLFRTEALEPFHVKGKEEPVRAYAVYEATGVKPPETKSELPFHGRDAELSAMLGIVTTCASSGRGGMLTLVGDTGVGKSRLANEVLARCEDMDICRIQAEPYGSDTPYWALRDPLRKLLDIGSTTREEQIEEMTALLTARAPHLVWALPLFGDLVHVPITDNAETAAIDPRYRPARTADALVSLFDAMFERPMVLFAEDGQWLDGSTIDALRVVGEAATERPWTVIVTARGDDTEVLGTEIKVPPLDEAAVRQIAIEATASAPLRPHDLDAIVARAGGNPLFLGEILGVVKETGSVEDVPDSLDAVVSKQIDTLPPLSRQALRQLSVLGRSFRTDVMRKYLSASDIASDRAIEHAIEPFLEQDGPTRTRFRHAVVRDVAYGGLPYRRRRELHAVAGAMIEQTAADDPIDAAELLALHFSEAGEHSKAWRYSRLAGDKAKRTYANVEAASHYRRAAEAARNVSDAQPADVAEVWTRLGEVRDLMGHYEEARDAFARAARLIRQDHPKVAELHLRRAEAWFGSGNMTQAKRSLTMARKALGGASDPGSPGLLARIDAYESSVHAATGHPRAALEAANRAIESARELGEDEALARAYGSLDWANFMMGIDEPRRGEEAVRIYHRLGQLDRSAMTMNMMGAFAYLEGRWDEAVDWYRQSVEAAEQSGNTFYAATTRANVAEVLVSQRRFDEAFPLLDEAGRFFEASRSEYGKPFVDLQLALARAATGDLNRAIEEMKRLYRLQLDTGEGFSWPETAVYLASTLLEAGRSRDSEETISEFKRSLPESAARLGPDVARVEALLAADSGDTDGAMRILRQAREDVAGANAHYSELLILEAITDLQGGAGQSSDPADSERLTELTAQLGVAATARIT
jgi:class 3 adenylate cyclase/predicted ATPase